MNESKPKYLSISIHSYITYIRKDHITEWLVTPIYCPVTPDNDVLALWSLQTDMFGDVQNKKLHFQLIFPPRNFRVSLWKTVTRHCDQNYCLHFSDVSSFLETRDKSELHMGVAVIATVLVCLKAAPATRWWCRFSLRNQTRWRRYSIRKKLYKRKNDVKMYALPFADVC